MSGNSAKLLTLEAFRDQFNRALAGFMTTQTAAAADLDPTYGELVDEIATFLARGGKRLRPYLTYLSYIGFGGRDEAAVTRLAISQELYHNAWLAHDDIIDRDLVRYGGPNVAGAYLAKFNQAGTKDAAHLASAMSLVAGDLTMSLAVNIILGSEFSAELKVAAARVTQDTTFLETGGEMLDVLMPTLPLAEVTRDRLLRVCRLKTAAYSFEAPLRIGAILAGHTPDPQTKIAAFATPLGAAFQIADDLLGTFGDERQLGKPVLSDLREGKRTLLLLHGLELAKPAERAKLEAMLGQPDATYADLQRTREILEASGARAKTEALARAKIDEALEALGEIGFTPEVVAVLRQLSEYMIRRQS